MYNICMHVQTLCSYIMYIIIIVGIIIALIYVRTFTCHSHDRIYPHYKQLTDLRI